jgi:hypothetical protein
MPDAGPLYDEAVALLRKLSGADGIRASLSTSANYDAVFTRDAVMAGIAGLMLEDASITQSFARTLERLRELQGSEGQIASNYAQSKVSFGTIVPRIDATTWYLVGVALACRSGIIDRAAFDASVRAAVRLLDALEYNGRHLIYIPAGGNWADEYVYDGYILYDQLLRAWALRLSGKVYDEAAWIQKCGQIEAVVGERYWLREAAECHPLTAISPTAERNFFDLAACSVLAVSGLLPERTAATLGWIDERFLGESRLPPAFQPVIDEGHPDWPALRRYHLYDFRNQPHEYHNGGIWPIWLGWLALGLAVRGHTEDLVSLRDLALDMLRSSTTFRFHEFLHGMTLAPGGMSDMAYSATGIVFLTLAGSSAQRRVFTA